MRSPAKERAAHRPGKPRRGGQALEVTEVTVLPAGEEPAQALDGVPPEADDPWGVAAELFPGIRDEHDDEDELARAPAGAASGERRHRTAAARRSRPC